MDKKSFLLTEEVARQAVEMVLPAIEAMMASGQAKRHALHIVVMDPIQTYASGAEFEDAVLYEYQVGDPTEWTEWTGPYEKVARSKAGVSWRTGLPSQLVQQRCPYMYEYGDTKWGGSAVLEGTLVVAASGVQYYYDQLFSEWVASACRALALEGMSAVMDSDAVFLGETGN